MAKEYKEKSTRNYIRSENTIETSRDSEIENISDVTTAARSQMSSETANVIDGMRSFQVGAYAIYTAGPKATGQLAINGSTGYTMSNASSVSNSDAHQYAQDITKRALE